MNRLDIWLTNPPAGDPPCRCGHEYDDHWLEHADFETACAIDDCRCTEYRERDLDEERDDAILARAEERAGR